MRARWQREGAASGQEGLVAGSRRLWRTLVQNRRRRARRVLRAGWVEVVVVVVEEDADRLKEMATLETRRTAVVFLYCAHRIILNPNDFQILYVDEYRILSPPSFTHIALPLRVCRCVLPLASPVCDEYIIFCALFTTSVCVKIHCHFVNKIRTV